MSWQPKEDVWWIPWKFQGLQRVRLFIWLAFKQRYENGSATAGGIVRNQSVEWIFGFNRFLGSCSMFEVDNLETVKAFQENPIGRSNSTLIRRILQVLSRFESWSISHIPIKDNQEADSL
ncbi:hypothetical protein Gotri_000153, partial [Gossypium trilobum]|nr:hypothetical protein [Gossypium trilobum]